VSERDGFLARWSRRKRDAAAGRTLEEAPPASSAPSAPAPLEEGVQPVPAAPLPPVESLTPESDFTPFMAKEVDPELQRSALKTLFRDERYNVMDGLDVYIDDYTKPAPIPAEWYERMTQLAGLGDVPAREAAAREAEQAAAQEAEQAAREAEQAAAPEEPGPQASGNPDALPVPAEPASPGAAPSMPQSDDSRDGPHEPEHAIRQ
jgi:hypothetical protein